MDIWLREELKDLRNNLKEERIIDKCMDCELVFFEERV